MNQSMATMWVLLMLAMVLLPLGQVLARPPKAKERRRSDAQRVIDAIPVADRAYFVTVHLAMEAKQQGRNDVSVRPGVDRIPNDLYEEFKYNLQNVTIPSNFGRRLLEWSESLVSNERRIYFPVHDSITSPLLKVCFPSGCVDPGDIGASCCPF